MAASPLPERHGIPGRVLLGFMAGAVVVRAEAFRAVGGYDPRFFIGSEEETLAVKLARAGWQMRYLEDLVVRHEPSLAYAPAVRPFLIATRSRTAGFTGASARGCAGRSASWPTSPRIRTGFAPSG